MGSSTAIEVVAEVAASLVAEEALLDARRRRCQFGRRAEFFAM